MFQLALGAIETGRDHRTAILSRSLHDDLPRFTRLHSAWRATEHINLLSQPKETGMSNGNMGSGLSPHHGALRVLDARPVCVQLVERRQLGADPRTAV
jgi:hypothetical protein